MLQLLGELYVSQEHWESLMSAGRGQGILSQAKSTSQTQHSTVDDVRTAKERSVRKWN